jgi:FG-GAP-like repeat
LVKGIALGDAGRRACESGRGLSIMHAIAGLVVTALLSILPNTAWGQPFAGYDLRVNGAVITVLSADLRGQRRQDLIVISRTGTFPRDMRWISVFWQQEGGRFNSHPDLVWEMDPDATVIDVGALRPESDRKSIVYLTGAEVRAYQLTDKAPPTPTTLLKIPTLTVFPEPTDLPPLRLIRDWKGNGQPWLGVPQFGQLILYPIAQAGLQGAGEAVKFYQPTLLFGAEREHRLLRDYALQLIYRLPQLFVRDFNGDGRADLIAAWQDHVAVYVQDVTGRFPQEPSQTFHFNIRTEQERTLRAVLISPLVEDVDGDGRADLILTKMTGRITDRHVATSVYLNRAGNLPSQPVVRVEHDGFASTLLAQDLNGDGKRDLVLPLVKIGVRNLMSNLLTNRVDVSLLVHLYREPGIYPSAPDWTRSFTYQIDMSDGVVLQGVWPNIDGDFDGDGKADLLVAGNDEIAVYLATPGTLFARDPAARMPVKTSPRMLVQDLTDNRHADIIIWYVEPPEWRGVIKVLINTAKGW